MIHVSKIGIIHVYMFMNTCLVQRHMIERKIGGVTSRIQRAEGGGGGSGSPDPLRKNTSGYNFPKKF